MRTAIITGANGFIGSHLSYYLLAQGWNVCAVGRRHGTNGWRDRVLAALGDVGDTADLEARLTCDEVDLLAPDLTLESSLLDGHSALETTLFHLAGDTRFTPPDPGFQRRVNIEASINIVEALQERIGRVVHVSTAYVCGNRTGVIRETELDCGQEFHNSYEKSKLDAEVALTTFCREAGVPLIIVRPAIITNDRQSGRASTFTHLNALVEVISRIQEHYGISDGQVVSEQIRLVADHAACPNMAPVDSIVPPLLQIAGSATAPGKTFHLCHPSPQNNAEIVSVICEAFGVSGKLALEFVAEIPRPVSRTEEMLLRSLKVYRPYLNSHSQFDLSNTRSVAPDYDAHFTALDVSYVRKIIGFQRAHRR